MAQAVVRVYATMAVEVGAASVAVAEVMVADAVEALVGGRAAVMQAAAAAARAGYQQMNPHT